MAFLDELLTTIGTGVGGLLGGAAGTLLLPGPGSVAGAAIGSSLGGFLGGAAGDAIGGDKKKPKPSVQTSGTGLAQGAGAAFPTPPGFSGGASGGGGAGSSFAPSGLPAIPTPPGGGLQGPVYSTQSGGLIPQAAQALNTIIQLLRAYPVVSSFLQRRWDFPTESEVVVPKSEALWRALAQQIPKTHRQALEQFLVGFPSPVGLTKGSEDVFLTLMIAEAGYSPEQIGCCFMGGK